MTRTNFKRDVDSAEIARLLHTCPCCGGEFEDELFKHAIDFRFLVMCGRDYISYTCPICNAKAYFQAVLAKHYSMDHTLEELFMLDEGRVIELLTIETKDKKFTYVSADVKEMCEELKKDKEDKRVFTNVSTDVREMCEEFEKDEGE